MEHQKEETVTLLIEDISSNGEGIGRIDGYTLFVKDAVIGDQVEAKITKTKKTYGYARLMRIISPSADRVEPACPVARQCGGCQIQQMSYQAQLAFKQQMVENNLQRIGGLRAGQDYTLYPIIGMEEPWHYRNKAQYPVGRDKDGHIIMGFYAGRTHHIVANEDCRIGQPVNAQILQIIRQFMEQFGLEPYQEENGSGLVRHILIRSGYHTGEVMVCVIINGKSLPHAQELAAALQKIPGMMSVSYNANRENTNVIMGKRTTTIWGRPYIEDRIGEIRYQISPRSFFQVNPQQTEKLYARAVEYADLHGNETVWDLYCGIGTISLFMAKKAARVYGVEIVPEAVADARDNAKLNKIDNTEFYIGKAEEVVPAFYQSEQTDEKGRHPDVIVVDPPRKGCDEALLSTMIQMQPDRIVYVSCDSATLARDLKYLSGNGYHVQKVQPVDQFAHSVHVECVVLMSRVSNEPR